jgi:hypothetical protein
MARTRRRRRKEHAMAVELAELELTVPVEKAATPGDEHEGER